MTWAQKQKGFTIVELLIVVVVIAILAAITIVAYNGIRDRANASVLQDELTSVAKKLQLSKVDSGSEQFPLTLADAGVTNSTLTYNVNSGSGRTDFCIEGTRGQAAYFLTSQKPTPQSGNCTISNGLVGWWKFNANANDSAGSNNGIVTNATLTAGYDASANGAYTFNGSSAYITANTPSIERTSYAVSLWFKTSSTADKKLVSTTGGGSHIVQVMTGGVLRTCINACFLGTKNVADGKWHFVLATGSATGTTVYLDGVAAPELTSPYSGTFALGSQIRIGAEYTPMFFFDGQMDDVRVYNRTLSVDEMQVLYSAGAK